MKYLYIVGLEHSGTTLLSHLLSQHPSFLALGEVGSFFSSAHMDHYFSNWGSYSDATLCSCGSEWADCEFWSELIYLAGHQTRTMSLVEKYKLLFEHIRKNHPPETVVIDSSKSISTLKMLLENKANLGIDVDDIFVLHAVKDVRNFATSIGNKINNKNSLLANYRSFNWWLYENSEIIKFLEKFDVRFWLSLYDNFCDNVDESLRQQFEMLGHESITKVDVSHSKSHIVMGNKNFTTRNRNRVVYDARWKKNKSAKLAYLLHKKARTFNEFLYDYQNDEKT